MLTKRRLSWLGLALVCVALGPGDERGSAVGSSFRIPYQLTQTNHSLVRVKINGKGPFNFLVDTGAPALYVSTETARKADLTPSKTSFWTIVDRLDLEGGAILTHVKARVDDPFQLTGMNALGLPGASIDGILGFTILARFRMEFDPTQDRLVWTLLDYKPPDPPTPRRGEEKDLPVELQMMNMLGPLAKLIAPVLGKQPAERLDPRGFFGMELADAEGRVRIDRVLADSPAAKAGVQADDLLARLVGREIKTPKEAKAAVSEVKGGDRVNLTVRRGPDVIDLTITAGEGL